MASRYPRHRVRSYVRSDGTFVRGHYRANPGQSSTSPPASSSSGLEIVIGVILVITIIGALAFLGS